MIRSDEAGDRCHAEHAALCHSGDIQVLLLSYNKKNLRYSDTKYANTPYGGVKREKLGYANG